MTYKRLALFAAALLAGACGSGSDSVAVQPPATFVTATIPPAPTTTVVFTDVKNPQHVSDCNMAIDRPACLQALPGAAAPPAATGQPQAKSALPQASDGTFVAKGVMRVRNSTMHSFEKQFPQKDSCKGWGGDSFQVQALDGSKTIFALASFSDGKFSKQVYDGFTFRECDFVYSLTLTPKPVYTIRLVRNRNDSVVESTTLSHEQLLSKGAPFLVVENRA